MDSSHSRHRIIVLNEPFTGLTARWHISRLTHNSVHLLVLISLSSHEVRQQACRPLSRASEPRCDLHDAIGRMQAQSHAWQPIVRNASDVKSARQFGCNFETHHTHTHQFVVYPTHGTAHSSLLLHVSCRSAASRSRIRIDSPHTRSSLHDCVSHPPRPECGVQNAGPPSVGFIYAQHCQAEECVPD